MTLSLLGASDSSCKVSGFSQATHGFGLQVDPKTSLLHSTAACGTQGKIDSMTDEDYKMLQSIVK